MSIIMAVNELLLIFNSLVNFMKCLACEVFTNSNDYNELNGFKILHFRNFT